MRQYVKMAPLLVLIFVLRGSFAYGESEAEVVANIANAHGFVLKNLDGKVQGVSLCECADRDVVRIRFGDLAHLKGVYLGGTTLSDRSLIHVGKSARPLEHITVDRAKITDVGLTDFLRNQKELRFIDVAHTPVSDKSVAELAKLENLSSVSLRGTKITDGGLKSLATLPDLLSLDLGDTLVSDAGLKHVKQISGLAILRLDGTKITDAGLQELVALGNLRLVGVGSTKVTEAGKASLQKLLPNLKFAKEP